MRIALGLEYDGSPFCGWQTQPSRCGIQDHLEAALAGFVGSAVTTTVAGRTDAGVHASAQVVHFDVDVERDSQAWVRGVNTRLDPRIRVVWAAAVADAFHARFQAASRTYDYWLLSAPVSPGLWHGRVGWTHLPQDLERMRNAAASLIGEHDFTSFRAAECQASTPVRHLSALDISGYHGLIRLRFTANAFLQHMVRNLVGALVYVGAARKPPEWMADVLAARDRAQAAPTFDAAGLYLSGVAYPAHFDLPGFPARGPFPP